MALSPSLALTCNGPGETAGWLRPLLRALYELEPTLDAYVFYVPDDYATGAEPQTVRTLFPQARVYDVREYLRVALGRSVEGLPDRVNATLYLGGDLMHAARLHRRLGGAFATYRFSKKRYAAFTRMAFAIDQRNAHDLAACEIAPSQLEIVGNLAIDGALNEAASAPEMGAPEDGILFMPGSRDYEIEHVAPLFFTAALTVAREDPNIPIAFGIAPFTSLAELRQAIEAGGGRAVFSQRGRLIEDSGIFLSALDGTKRFPVLRNAMAAAKRARLAVTIPGTKVIELAALGVPAVACSPLNIPELVTINGPLTYLNRIPFIGVPLKRALVTGVSRRHRFHTQPNIDTQEEIVRELHGTLTPGRVARVALDCFDDDAWLHEAARQSAALYAGHAGAAGRMARSLLKIMS